MGSRLSDVPWWAWSLVYSATFAAVRVGVALLDTPGTMERVLLAVGGGLVAGALAGPFLARMNRRAGEAMGPLTPEEERQAARATMRGPVPADPRVREAAERLAEFRRAQNVRGRPVTTTVFGLSVLGCLYAAVSWTPLWAVAALPLMTLAGYSFWLPAYLEQRIDLLHDPSPDTPPAMSLGPQLS